MTRRALPVTLVCAATLCAQQQSPEVQDLLAGEARESRAEQVRVVQRPRLQEYRTAPDYVVSGEVHLAAFDDGAPRSRPFFDEDSLARLLATLRPVRGDSPRFVRFGERVELRSTFPEQTQAALAEVRRALPPRVRCTLRLERIVGGAAVVLLEASEVFANGETLVIGDVETRPLVTDVDVEIAQASAIANPVERQLTFGTSALLRARPLPWRDEAVVELVVRHATPFEVGSIPSTQAIGGFDRLASRIDEAGLVFRVARGDAQRHRWTADDGSTLQLTCTVGWDDAPARDTSVVVTPLLHAPVLGFRSTRGGEPEDVRECLPVGSLIASRVESGDDGGDDDLQLNAGPGEPGTALVLRSDAARVRAERLFRRVDSALQPTAVTVEVLSVPAGTEVAAGGDAPASATRLWRASGPGIVGLPSCFTTGSERSYVRDWDTEVAQAARIADPKIAVCEDGWFATVKPLATVPGQTRRVELALHRIMLLKIEQLDLPIANASLASTESNEVVLPREVVAIEKPITRAVEIATTLQLDGDGNAVLRRAAPLLLGADRELVVRVQAR